MKPGNRLYCIGANSCRIVIILEDEEQNKTSSYAARGFFICFEYLKHNGLSINSLKRREKNGKKTFYFRICYRGSSG
jgi:hypothetical protein